MNKLLIALPILALLSIGAVLVLSHKKAAETVETTAASTVSFQSWEGCRKNSPICDNMTKEQQGENQVNLYACYAAGNKINSMFSAESATITANCSEFQKTFKNGQAADMLPASYATCVGDMTPEAQKSDFFFNNIFKPLYMTCGGL